MTIQKLKAGQAGGVGVSKGSDVANAVNSLIDIAQISSKRKKFRLMQIGDSLVGSPSGILSPTGLTYFYSSGLSQLFPWVADVELELSTGAPATGILKTDGDGTLQFNYNSQGFGAKVDVSVGGFFAVPSIGGVTAYVKILKLSQPAISRQDTITFGTLRALAQLGGLNTFAEYVNGRVSNYIDVFNFGIAGDSIQGVASRWRQAFNLSNPDAITLLVGTNSQPTTISAADDMLAIMLPIITEMLTEVNFVFVGGLFPRGGITQAQSDAMNYFSSKLRDFCDATDGAKYWDSFPYLVENNVVNSSAIKTEAYHTDGIHLNPYGACLAAKPLISALFDAQLISLSNSLSRGLTTEQYSLNPNPLFLGSGGSGSGSNGVTGTVPTSWSVGRTGGTQSCALSQIQTETQSQLRVQLSGATTASDRNEILSNMNISAGQQGRFAKLKIRAEITSASLLNQFEFAVIGAGNAFFSYFSQGSRVISGVVAGTGFVIDFESKPFLLPVGIAVAGLRIRLGTASGGSADIILKEFSVILD